jgi:protoporphyrinogen oxidase
MDETSAWAGIHYFASRDGTASNADTHALVTWPSGIGWVVKKMARKLGPALRYNACVLNIEPSGDGVAVDYWDTVRQLTVRIHAQALIYAAPRFTALKTIAPLRERPPAYSGNFTYAPWMVANITLKEPPEGKGAALSWDNVSYHSESLGYVVANHQDLASHPGRTVVTYYYPLTFGDAVSQRQLALKRTHADWVDIILKDLSRMHQGIANNIEEVDVWLWGHAMSRPVPDFIWGAARQEALKPLGRIYFAHSDMSGISIFEEAQYRGIMAARQALHGLRA